MSGYVDPPAYDPDCPCESCEHSARCEAEFLACAEFASYTEMRKGEGRHPSRDIYRAIFEGAELTAEMKAQSWLVKKMAGKAANMKRRREERRREVRATVERPAMFSGKVAV